MFHKDGKINPWMVSTFLLLGIVIGVSVSQGYNLIFKKNPVQQQSNNVQQQQQQQNDEPVFVANVSTDDDPYLGSDDAKVTIVEFSDYQCPLCYRFFIQTFEQLKKDYIDTGKVNFVFRDFPLIGKHLQALKAAETANCALDQEKYWEMHELIFTKIQDWSANEKASDLFKTYASDLGLDTVKFNDCLDTDKYVEEIAKDINDGKEYGVRGTPYFYVNGRLIPGAMAYASFKQIIEEELAK
jgi:protein-disulfide isomerase